MFPKSGFEVIDVDIPFEEETLPTYDSTLYYPMRIGDIVGGHYQVVSKLGFGSTSTVWLASDLKYEQGNSLISRLGDNVLTLGTP